jgi:hypothetical protein
VDHDRCDLDVWRELNAGDTPRLSRLTLLDNGAKAQLATNGLAF